MTAEAMMAGRSFRVPLKESVCVIEGQEKITLADWSQGRHTSDNQAIVPNNALLVARNVIRQAGAL